MADCPDAAYKPGFRLLSYEGHTGLWSPCLWVLSRLHIGYAGMRYFAAAIGFAGVTVLVTTSPFPRFIKLLLPFTFHLAFQYAVAARSYVRVPLLFFLCAYSAAALCGRDEISPGGIAI